MYYSVEAPPGVVIPPRAQSNRKYGKLFATVQEAAGEWVKVPHSEVTGRTPGAKQAAIHAAAQNRGIPVQTRVVGEFVYVRGVNRG
jgi:hypothetical protein